MNDESRRPDTACPDLVVAFAPDSPPYVMDGGTAGVEVDLAHRLLEGRAYRVVQMPYKELQEAIGEGIADVAIPVQACDDGVHYSDDFTVFHNVAISKKADDLRIESVAELKDHRVLAWQNAYSELGETFEALYAPPQASRASYAEIGDQREQVAAFWRGEDKVVVIDLNIFRHFSREMGHAPDETVVHWIFAAETPFQAGFRDAALRDTFNERLAVMRADGEYQAILDRYDFKLADS